MVDEKVIKQIVDIQNDMGAVRQAFNNYSVPTAFDGMMYLILEQNKKLDKIIELLGDKEVKKPTK